METYKIVWLLCSLVTFLIFSHVLRRERDSMEYWEFGDWVAAIVASLLFPLGLLIAFCIGNGWDFMTREIHLRKDHRCRDRRLW